MKYFSTILFDIDSTLVTIEGVDWLASQKGVYEEVSQLTQKSMDGLVPIEQVFETKINILSPSRYDFLLLGKQYTKSLCEDAFEVITALKFLHKDIWLVTGSFKEAIVPLAENLGITEARIIANSAFYEACGCYKIIDKQSPLTKANGKARVVERLGNGQGYVFVGDSVTDLATKSCVDLFIGYGGIVSREKVQKEADVFLTTKSLAPLLSILLTPEEKELLSKKYVKLLVKAETLAAQGAVITKLPN